MKIERVYIAASTGDMDRAQHWANHLACAGIECASGWLKSVADNGGVANPRGADKEKRAGWSRENRAAIESSQLLWFLVPPVDVVTRGAWWEVGLADALDRIIVCSGQDTEQSVVCALYQEFNDDLTAFATICRLARVGAWV